MGMTLVFLFNTAVFAGIRILISSIIDMDTIITKQHYFNPLVPEFFFFVVFRDIALDRLFSSTDS